MGIFDTIKDAIWGTDEPVQPTPRADPVGDAYLGVDQATTGVVADVSTPANDPAMRDIAASGVQPVTKPVNIQSAQNPTARVTEIDVATQLDAAARARGQDLNWRTSIVDLMKVVGMDASLQERRDLARELNYNGDTNDTASMNMFLHRALMKKLAENGGKVPADYLD
ncbi:MAG: DUF3597 domain-containing protein [Rhizobium sp.]|nr:DUF3597 domain-containing protein [Rhizobium sp.]